jgi:3-methyl-2-oxobutanoate hydroxymethyltransferase
MIQGRGEAADAVLADAKAVEAAGAFAVVLEMIPAELAARITAELTIPTISVGAGAETDGQLLVWTDFAGMNTGRVPKFVKQYANLGAILSDAAKAFKADVESGTYPGPEHSYEDN